MPDAPTPDDLAAIRARHRPAETEGRCAYQGCSHCGQSWPCDAARLLAALDAETALWRAAEDDLAAMTARAAAAEVRLPTKAGGTMVVTAVELWASHRQARDLYERARFWAAGWRRAAYDHRDRADVALDAGARADERLAALQAEHDAWLARAGVAGMYPDEVAAVVQAARALVRQAGWLDRSTVLGLHALVDALAALDAATKGEDDGD